MDRWSFYDLNRFHDKWFIIFHRKFDCQISLLFQFLFENMSKQIAVKYY